MGPEKNRQKRKPLQPQADIDAIMGYGYAYYSGEVIELLQAIFCKKLLTDKQQGTVLLMQPMVLAAFKTIFASPTSVQGYLDQFYPGKQLEKLQFMTALLCVRATPNAFENEYDTQGVNHYFTVFIDVKNLYIRLQDPLGTDSAYHQNYPIINRSLEDINMAVFGNRLHVYKGAMLTQQHNAIDCGPAAVVLIAYAYERWLKGESLLLFEQWIKACTPNGFNYHELRMADALALLQSPKYKGCQVPECPQSWHAAIIEPTPISSALLQTLQYEATELAIRLKDRQAYLQCIDALQCFVVTLKQELVTDEVLEHYEKLMQDFMLIFKLPEALFTQAVNLQGILLQAQTKFKAFVAGVPCTGSFVQLSFVNDPVRCQRLMLQKEERQQIESAEAEFTTQLVRIKNMEALFQEFRNTPVIKAPLQRFFAVRDILVKLLKFLMQFGQEKSFIIELIGVLVHHYQDFYEHNGVLPSQYSYSIDNVDRVCMTIFSFITSGGIGLATAEQQLDAFKTRVQEIMKIQMKLKRDHKLLTL